MRKILLSAIIGLCCIPANAAVTVEQMTDSDFVINNGYSEAAAEEILISKNRNNGKPVEPLYPEKCSKVKMFWRSMYGYIDPSIDTPERYHHDIHQSPSFRDL